MLRFLCYTHHLSKLSQHLQARQATDVALNQCCSKLRGVIRSTGSCLRYGWALCQQYRANRGRSL